VKDFPIPVRADFGPWGPASQALDDDLRYTPMPRDVRTFSMPRPPEDAGDEALTAARNVLARLADAMGGKSMPRIDLVDFDRRGLAVLDDMLGEGEVSVRIRRRDGVDDDIRIQESVFAGVWRERHFDGEHNLIHDFLVAGAIPPIAIESAQAAASATLATLRDTPAGAMNAPALLTEIAAQMRTYRPAAAPHVINLTLLPLTPQDMQLLERLAPPGPVAILSRGFGNCRVTSTGLRNVWRVQYFNSMQTLILNTLEITRVPEVALAAADDLADSRDRLRDLIGWMARTGA
jgi:hydrogenase-1 operon protein HyaF